MAKDPAVSSIEVDCLQRADMLLPESNDSSLGAHDTTSDLYEVGRKLSVQVGAPWGIDRIDTNGRPIDNNYDDGDLTGKGVRVYIVDTGVQGSHDDFGGRVVNGHTVRAHHSRRICTPPAHRLQYHAPQHTPTTRSPITTPATLSLHPSLLAQAYERTECASCQAVNGILPADGSGCNGHGTHVASTVGGLKHGVAKEVTIVPAFSCFKLQCSDGSYGCSATSDISANLECAPPPVHACARRRPRRRCRRCDSFSVGYYPDTALVPPPSLTASQPPALARPNGRPALVAAGGRLPTAQRTPKRAA